MASITNPARENTHVSHADSKFQFSTHASNDGGTKVGPIEQADAVHEADKRNESEVDLAHDSLVLFGADLVDDGVNVALGRGAFDLFEMGVAGVLELLDIAIHGCHCCGGALAGYV